MNNKHWTFNAHNLMMNNSPISWHLVSSWIKVASLLSSTSIENVWHWLCITLPQPWVWPYTRWDKNKTLQKSTLSFNQGDFVLNWISSYLFYFLSLNYYYICFHCSYLYNYYNCSRILYIKYTILCIKPRTQHSKNLNFGRDFISPRFQYLNFFSFNKVSSSDSHTRENQWSGFQLRRGSPQIRTPRWYSKICLLPTQHWCSH